MRKFFILDVGYNPHRYDGIGYTYAGNGVYNHFIWLSAKPKRHFVLKREVW